MQIEAQIERLEVAVRSLLTAVGDLGAERFLGPIHNWSSRDIVAHLIGWNRHVIEGSRQIACGELPFYDVDPGRDYAKVNAELLRRYPSRDPETLGRELRISAAELHSFLATLDPEIWRRDHGVRHDGEVVTIESTVDDLIADYEHHQRQLEGLLRR